MHKYIPLLLLLGLLHLTQCKKAGIIREEGKNLLRYTWGTNDQTYIENFKFHSFRYLDTLENQLKGDTLVPIQFINGDRLIISQLVPTSMELVEREGITEYVITRAQFLPDTFTLATKKYIDKQFLLLFSNTVATRVLELKTSDEDIPVIRPDYQPAFKIAGYSVGDKIDRDQLDVFLSDIFGSRITEEAYLAGNEDIKFTIVGHQYIEKIKKTNIRDEDLNPLIKSIDKIFSKDHEYEEITTGSDDFKETVKGYYWNEKDVSIFLQKIESPFEDDENNYWTLEYSNYIITTILQNYLEMSPENI